MTILAGTLFLIFGILSLKNSSDDDKDENLSNDKSKHILMATFSLIFFAELGDKTQLATATLASTSNEVGVWIGATLALGVSSALGVYAGSRWLSKIDTNKLHKLSGAFFIIMAFVIFYRLF